MDRILIGNRLNSNRPNSHQSLVSTHKFIEQTFNAHIAKLQDALSQSAAQIPR